MMSLKSQTLPNINTFDRTKLNDNSFYKKLSQRQYQTQIFSFDSPPITTPSPINTASSPIPIHPKQNDDEFLMEELESQTYSELELEETTTIEDHQTNSDQQEAEDEDEEMNLTSNSSTCLREPSPDSNVLFENPNSISADELPILSSDSIKIISDSIVKLSPVIAQALCRYRAQLNEWENAKRVDEPVLKASAFVDQCLLRVVMILEPIWNQSVKPLISLQNEFKSLQSDYQSDQSNHDPNFNLIYLNKLMKLSDSISIIKENLTDLSKHINDLYEWVDGFLTPILAELSLGEEDELNQCEIESERRSAQVSILLDAQSYLCIAIDLLATNLNLFKVSFLKLSLGLDRFINRVESLFGIPWDRSRIILGFEEVLVSLESYDHSCLYVIQSLSVLASISMAIQKDTIGTLHSISYQC